MKNRAKIVKGREAHLILLYRRYGPRRDIVFGGAMLSWQCTLPTRAALWPIDVVGSHRGKVQFGYSNKHSFIHSSGVRLPAGGEYHGGIDSDSDGDGDGDFSRHSYKHGHVNTTSGQSDSSELQPLMISGVRCTLCVRFAQIGSLPHVPRCP